MAKQTPGIGGRNSARKPARSRLSLANVLGLILIIEALGLGLKFYDDRRKLIEARQTEVHREALAVSEHISGKISTAAQTLRLGHQAGWGAEQIARAYPDIESVVSLADALTAEPQSRLWSAGETASQLFANGRQVGLTARDDLIIAVRPELGPAQFALVPVRNWLPAASGGRQFDVLLAQPEGAAVSARDRVTGCSTVSGSELSVCVHNEIPSLTLTVLVDILLLGLLLLAPALAVLGVYRLFEQRHRDVEEMEGEATRAGRVLKTVLSQARAGFWSWDPTTQRIVLSEEAASLLGPDVRRDLPIDDFLRLVSDEHRGGLREALSAMLERGYLAQVFSTADRSIWFDMRARPDEGDGSLNGILRDVTATKLAIARSRQAESRLRGALEGFSGPFALWDKRQRLVYWNRAFANVFAVEDNVRAGMGYDTAIMSQAANVDERRTLTEDPGAEVIKIRDGSWYKIVERKTKTGGMITVGLDVSQDIRNEVELTRQQSRLRKLVAELERSETKAAELTQNLKHEKQRAENSANSKNAFLANMSHELRTPLNAINGFSEILVDEMYGPLGDVRYKEYARDILASGKHLLDMITDILDMAKIEAGKMTVDLQPIDIVDPVDAAIRMIRRKAEEKNISLKLVSNPNLPLVEADHRAIRQMILNLVSNAIKFTDEGGEIRVTVDQKGRDLRISVRDNGIGIPTDALPRLGEPFEQVSDTRDRNYEGTGLGLALTKSFAEMHGGRLTIASEPGRGTQVSFFLPLPDQRPHARSSVA